MNGHTRSVQSHTLRRLSDYTYPCIEIYEKMQSPGWPVFRRWCRICKRIGGIRQQPEPPQQAGRKPDGTPRRCLASIQHAAAALPSRSRL